MLYTTLLFARLFRVGCTFDFFLIKNTKRKAYFLFSGYQYARHCLEHRVLYFSFSFYIETKYQLNNFIAKNNNKSIKLTSAYTQTLPNVSTFPYNKTALAHLIPTIHDSSRVLPKIDMNATEIIGQRDSSLIIIIECTNRL